MRLGNGNDSRTPGLAGYSDKASKLLKKKCIVGIELNFMKVRIFLSCGLRGLIAFQGATDKLLAPQNRFDSRPKIALDVHLINVALSAHAQSCPHDAEVTDLTEEDNLGAGRELSYLPGGFDSIQLGETDIQQNYLRFQVSGFLNSF